MIRHVTGAGVTVLILVATLYHQFPLNDTFTGETD